MLYDIFIDTLLCGATGYITNKHVINMLFKKYSIFNKIRCGNSIINSKIQFIKNVSILMENEIINAQKISDKFKIHNFNEEFESFSKDFFDECICRDIKNLRLKDIPVFYDACCSGRDVLINLLDVNMKSILQSISEEINLSKVFTTSQIKHISKNVIQNITLTIQNTKVIDNIASETFDAFCDVNINSIITKNIANKIKDNIEKESLKFGSIIKNNIDEEIDMFLNKILCKDETINILEKLQDSILERPLKSFISLKAEDISKILKNIIDFVTSQKGEKALSDIYYEVKSHIVNSNLSLYDITNNNYEEHIKNHMQGRVNNTAYSVMQWIDSNNIDLNNVIKESVDEIITGNDSLRNKIYLTINEYYNSKKYNDNSIVKMLLEFEVNNENIEKISSFIISEIRNYLILKDAKDIINILEDRHIINSNILTEKVISYLSDKSNNSIASLIECVISRPIKDFVDFDLIKLFNNKFKYKLIDYIKENTFYSKNVHLNITKAVNKYVFEAFDEKISEFINKEHVLRSVDDIKKILIKDIKNKESVLEEKISSLISDFILKNTTSDLIDKIGETNQNIDIKINEKLTELINKNFSRIVDDIGDVRVSKVLSKISNIPNIHDSLSDFMKNIVGESIATITEGYISEVVEKHFDELTDDEFINHIRETALIDPNKLALSGGIIGGTIGLSTSLAYVNLFSKSIINSVFSWQGVVLNSIIGVSTNFIAMHGFSTAYSTNGVLAKIPIYKNISENFIKKKQVNFANYMSEIVKANLIDEETIQDLVQSKSIEIKNTINRTIVDNEYKQVYECLENNNTYISTNLANLTKNILDKNKETVASYISKGVSNIPIKHLLNRNVIDSIMNEVSSKKSFIVDNIFIYIKKYLEENMSISDCIPIETLDRVKDEIILSIYDNFNNTIDFIKDIEGLKKYSMKYSKSYESFLNEPLDSIFSQNALDSMYSSLFNSLYSDFFTDDKLIEICENTYSTINEQFNINTTLGDALNRRSKVFLNGMFYKYFKDIIQSLQSNLALIRHTTIEKDIREKLLNSLSLKERAAYNSVGGDKVLYDIINNLILIKLPLFFDRNFEQFYEISKGITNDIFDNKIEDLGVSINKDKLENVINSLFVESKKTPIIKNKTYLVFNLYMQQYNQVELKAIAKYFYLDSLDNAFKRYETEILTFLKHLHSNSKKNNSLILKEANGLFKVASYSIFDSLLVKRLFYKTNKNDLALMENAIKDVIEANDLVYLNVNNIINSFYSYLEEIDLLDSIISINEFNSSLESVINEAVENKSFNTYIESLYSKIVSSDLKLSTYICVNKGVKKYFVDLLVDGFYVAIRKNLSKIFKSIDFDVITKEEIVNLPLKSYQEIYKVFWDNNLKNTIWTGIAGGVIGANKYTGIALTLLDTVKSFLPKFKNRKIKDQ